MSTHATQWIWQQNDWPNFHWEKGQIEPLLRQVRLQQGILLGKMSAIDEGITREAALDTLLQNIITSSAIEGETLNVQSVRSSLAKRIGLDLKETAPTSDRSEGLAMMMLNAINNLDKLMTLNRLFQWHNWLFPNTEQLLQTVYAGKLRGDDPMQVVSGRIDKPTVHFEAPPRVILNTELRQFLIWFNQSLHDPTLDPFLCAAICHFWFVTLHPFDDGNGRITRTLTDLALAQSEKYSIRLYAMSARILEKRRAYYNVLEKSQRNMTDITLWLNWFLETLLESLNTSINKIDDTLQKTRFWQHHYLTELSIEQRKILNRLLEGGKKGFEQGISASQYQKISKVTHLTHLRAYFLKNKNV